MWGHVRDTCKLLSLRSASLCRIVTAEPPVLIRRDGDARVRPAGTVPAAADLQHPRQNIAVFLTSTVFALLLE